jgi:8-hydroxy-5-deazaflavin:NADPH oxidoreductase
VNFGKGCGMARNVAVIGTGRIGGTIGRAFARAGHQVTFGTRGAADGSTAGDSGVAQDSVAGALAAADIVVLAVPGPSVAALVADNAGALAGKLIIDAANKVGGDGPANSHAEITALPGARYARAFNSLGAENFADPVFGAETADLIFSSPEADRAAVEDLIRAVGLRPVYAGDGAHEVVDGVLRLWFALAIGQGRGRHLAFRVLDDTGAS